MGTTSSHHGFYGQGYTRAARISTDRGKIEDLANLKRYRSTDWTLKLEFMKVESLVIVDQNATVNAYSDFAQTARHALGIDQAPRANYPIKHYNLIGFVLKGGVGNRGEVVTR
jgi:hypothetical protein